jgi:phospholipase/carboxylesterase
VPTQTDFPLQLKGWTYRFRPAGAAPARLLLMLHGWTGNENSMWLFTRNIQEQYAILLPRAPHLAPEGGYTWRQVQAGNWGLPSLEDLRPSAEAVIEFIHDWSTNSGVDVSTFDVTGFSQGAAMAYALALLFPGRVERVATLSGFLPAVSDGRLALLAGKRIFISHGRSDEMIPVERARQVRVLLEQAGAQVTYCETDGGHKVGKECLKGIESFFKIR